MKINEKHNFISSPLNYIGGKQKILKQILPLFPENIGTFIDLFAGGCNVGLNTKAKKVILNDNLTYLTDLYKEFQKKSYSSVIEHVNSRINTYNLSKTNDDGYKKLRQLYNNNKNPLDLFVLTSYSFNHQIRFNNSHEFNNPFGKNRSSFNISIEKKLEKFVKKIQESNVEIFNNSFDEIKFDKFDSNDFVYCDPPYLITTGTYNDGKRGFKGWGLKEEKKLLDLLDNLNKKKIKFALSNVLEHKGKINNILKDWLNKNNYVINYIAKNYSNSNYQTSFNDTDKTVEVLITNYKPKIEKELTLFDMTQENTHEIYREQGKSNPCYI